MKNLYTLLLLGLGFAFTLPVCRKKDAAIGKVRYPVRAGQFYPGSKEELAESVNGYLSNAAKTELKGEIVALWVPHAGYIFSGQTAADAYKTVQGMRYDDVVLVGPSHYAFLEVAALGDDDFFRTPLGDVQVDTAFANRLQTASPYIKPVPAAHEEEHSLEVQVPFIQTVLPNTPIVPLVLGSVSYEKSLAIGKAIAGVAKGKRVLLVASSDMSHYPSDADARKVDSEMLKAVGEFNPKKVLELNASLMKKRIPNLDCVLCGSSPLATVMLAAREMGADRAVVLPYTNSAEVSGDSKRVVGYGAAAFIKSASSSAKSKTVQAEKSVSASDDLKDDIPFSKEEKQTLFRIARESMLAALKNQELPEIEAASPNLSVKRGVFVTLTNRGRLRGCLGHFEADTPLAWIVQQMAAAAATQDYRFMSDPVTIQEMDRIDVKISILSALRRINSIDEIVIGRHGIWVKQGGRSGTYLPEVATELGWNKEEFLSHCCAEKAGLSSDAWKKGAEIFIYSSQILGEKE